ncbi:MAG: acyltransferase [Bacteroidota bacterium]
MSRLLWLQSARGVAALLVLFYHCGALAYESSTGPFFFGHAGVDLFFVISGYIIFRVHEKELGQLNALPGFLYKRFSRIYPPYWVATSLVLIGALIIPSFVEPEKLRPLAVIESYALFPINKFKDYPLLPVGWSLFFEMAFYTGFCVLFLVPRRFATAFLIFWVILGLWLLNWGEGTKGRSSLDGFLFFLTGLPVIEFLSGAFLAKLKRVPGSLAVWWLAIVICLVPSILIHGWFGRSLAVSFGYALGYWCVVSLTCFLDHNSPERPPEWLIKCGDQSYSIYLVHFPIILFLDNVIDKMGLISYRPISFLVLCLAGFFGGKVFFYVFEKPLLNFARLGYKHWFVLDRDKS